MILICSELSRIFITFAEIGERSLRIIWEEVDLNRLCYCYDVHINMVTQGLLSDVNCKMHLLNWVTSKLEKSISKSG